MQPRGPSFGRFGNFGTQALVSLDPAHSRLTIVSPQSGTNPNGSFRAGSGPSS